LAEVVPIVVVLLLAEADNKGVTMLTLAARIVPGTVVVTDVTAPVSRLMVGVVTDPVTARGPEPVGTCPANAAGNRDGAHTGDGLFPLPPVLLMGPGKPWGNGADGGAGWVGVATGGDCVATGGDGVATGWDVVGWLGVTTGGDVAGPVDGVVDGVVTGLLRSETGVACWLAASSADEDAVAADFVSGADTTVAGVSTGGGECSGDNGPPAIVIVAGGRFAAETLSPADCWGNCGAAACAFRCGACDESPVPAPPPLRAGRSVRPR
jgi:hypothetical protein